MNTPDTPTVHPDQPTFITASEVIDTVRAHQVPKRTRAAKGKAPSGKTTISVELPTPLANSLDAEAERRLIGRNVLVRKILEVALERLADQNVEITL